MAAEKNFENRIKVFLKELGCWYLKTWSNGVQRSGVADLLICCNGHFIAAELKAPRGKPSELQIHDLNKVEASGGHALLLYPKDFELFKEFIINLKLGKLYEAEKIYDALYHQNRQPFENMNTIS